MERDNRRLYSSMRFEGDGVTKVVALTFELREGDGLSVDFGYGLVDSGYIIDYDSQPVLIIFDEPLPKQTITIRRLTQISEVPHVFQKTGNAQGGSPFNAKNIDENFENITRASQDAMDSQTLASETLEEMSGIRDDAYDARDSAKVSASEAKESELKAKVSETNSKASEEEAEYWAGQAKDLSGVDLSIFFKKDNVVESWGSSNTKTLSQAFLTEFKEETTSDILNIDRSLAEVSNEVSLNYDEHVGMRKDIIDLEVSVEGITEDLRGLVLSSSIYPSVSEGLLQTQDGDYFLAYEDNILNFYKNIEGNGEVVISDVLQQSAISSALQRSKALSEFTDDNSLLIEAQRNIGVEEVSLEVRNLSETNKNIIGKDVLRVVDSSGLQTWLGADSRGLPTPYSMQGIKARGGLVSQSIGQKTLFSLTDSNGIRTVLDVGLDGRFSRYALDMISEDLAIKQKDEGVMFLGSSTVWLMQSGRYGNLINKYFKEERLILRGNSGAKIDFLMMSGGYPSNIEFSTGRISQGNSTSVITSWGNDSAMYTTNVEMDNGINGDLTYSNGSTFFTPSTSNHVLEGYKFSIFNTYGNVEFAFVNIGKNNMNTNSQGIGEEVYNKTLELVDMYIEKGIDYIVIDHFVNYNSSSLVAGEVRTCNNLLRDRFGNNFFSIYNALQTDEMWDWCGLIKTESDIEAIQKGELPPSFQADYGHMNAIATEFIVMKLYEKYEERRYV